MESKRQLTREELLEMESAPKTKMQHMLDVVICFCPYFAAIIMFLVYYLMPDAVQNFNPHVFTIVVCFFLALYLIMVVRGLLNKSYFAKVRHKAPLYSVIILVIMLYDFLTVKTGILKQPFFPCVNTILCAIIDDRALLLKSTLYSCLDRSLPQHGSRSSWFWYPHCLKEVYLSSLLVYGLHLRSHRQPVSRM